jgi:hypothetical protein
MSGGADTDFVSALPRELVTHPMSPGAKLEQLEQIAVRIHFAAPNSMIVSFHFATPAEPENGDLDPI